MSALLDPLPLKILKILEFSRDSSTSKMISFLKKYGNIILNVSLKILSF